MRWTIINLKILIINLKSTHPNVWPLLWGSQNIISQYTNFLAQSACSINMSAAAHPFSWLLAFVSTINFFMLPRYWNVRCYRVQSFVGPPFVWRNAYHCSKLIGTDMVLGRVKSFTFRNNCNRIYLSSNSQFFLSYFYLHITVRWYNKLLH